VIRIEVVTYNLEDAIAAAQNGAHRIELCTSPDEGGTTPSYETISAAKRHCAVSIHVMIRPRGGDFVYTDAEFATMKADIEICKVLNVDGIVFGILTKENNVNTKRCKELVTSAQPLTSNFHRAFDLCVDPFRALEDIIECGFQRILTSGGKRRANEGIDLLVKLVRATNGRIIIMPGGGVRKENFVQLVKTTGAKEFHTSAVNDIKSMVNSVWGIS
jgi:copper homeostasis protein